MTPEPAPEARVALRDGHVKVRREKFGTVIFDTRPPEDRIYVARGTAHRVLDLLLSGMSIGDAAKQLAQEYEGEEGEILRDTVEFVRQLSERSLVRIVAPGVVMGDDASGRGART